MGTKRWFHSKTEWAMFLALIGAIITGITGENWFDGDMQVAVLSFVGMLLRVITNTGLTK